MLDLEKSVQYVKNVGPTRVKLLNKLNIHTLQDLISYFPRNYEDRGVAKKLVNCQDGEEVLIKATAITKVSEIFARRLKIYRLVVRDGETPCTITWYNQSYLKNIFKIGHTYNFYGKVEIKLGRYEMKSPIFDESGEYYFFNGNNIENGNLVIKSDTKKVNFEEYKKYKKDLNNRTILVSINGTIGKVGIYNNEKCILGKSACYFNVKEEVNRDYIKFLLMNRNFQEYIKNYSTGTTIKNMSLKAMKEFEFELPIRSIQDKVAHILNSIERKIELNTHINNNLLAA